MTLARNRLPLIIAGVALVSILAMVFFRSKPQPTPTAVEPMPDPLPAGLGSQLPPADGDTVADTLRTISARFAEVQQHIAQMEQRIAQIPTTQAQALPIEETSVVPDGDETPSQTPDQATDASFAPDLVARLEALLNADRAPTDSWALGTAPPLPVVMPAAIAPATQDAGWVYPLDYVAPSMPEDGLDDPRAPWLGLVSGPGNVGNSDNEARLASRTLALPPAIPRYTIPATATLLDGVALTGLIGRVPVGGEIRDAFPFKVITGPTGWATNGIRLPPDLAGIVWAGTARGDWGLSCLSGDIETVTFTFADGRIQTVHVTDVRSGQRGERLAWISDAYGNPCIPGDRISNAGPAIAARIAAQGLEAAGDAFAEAQTQTVTTTAGSVLRNIEDATAFGGYEALAGGGSELRRIIDQRLAQTFDAVWAPNGTPLLVHVALEIPIDDDPSHRKVFYATTDALAPNTLD